MASDQLPNDLSPATGVELTALEVVALGVVFGVIGLPVASDFAALIATEAAELAAVGATGTLVEVCAVMSLAADDAVATDEDELACCAVFDFLV